MKNNNMYKPFNKWMLGIHREMLEGEQGRVSFVVGKKGSGKSWLTLFLGNYLTRINNPHMKFSVKGNMAFFEPWVLVERLRKAHLTPGSIQILDDGGLAVGSRQWGSSENKILSKIIQACRPTKSWIFISTPAKGLIDKQIRMLADDLIICKGFNKRTGMTRVRWQVSDPNVWDDSVFWKNITIGNSVVNSITFPSPPEKMAQEYVSERQRAWDRLMKEADEVRQGLDRGATLSTVASMTGISTRQLAVLVANEDFPIQRNVDTVKIPLSFVFGVTKTLGHVGGKTVTVLDKGGLPGYKHYKLPSGRYLVVM